MDIFKDFQTNYRQLFHDSELLTKNNTGLTLQLAINYGGRDEIVRTVQELTQSVLDGQLAVQDITEQYISDHLYTQEFSDVDLLIRQVKTIASVIFYYGS